MDWRGLVRAGIVNRRWHCCCIVLQVSKTINKDCRIVRNQGIVRGKQMEHWYVVLSPIFVVFVLLPVPCTHFGTHTREQPAGQGLHLQVGSPISTQAGECLGLPSRRHPSGTSHDDVC